MKLKVKTNARKTEILEESLDEMALAVKGKPEKGEANREIIRFLSKHFGKSVRIVRGLTSKNKIINISK